MAKKYPKSMPYVKAIFIALDQLVNAIFLGWPDETLSSRAYRWDVANIRHWPRRVLDWVAWHIFRDRDHCFQSFQSERLGRQLPPEARH